MTELGQTNDPKALIPGDVPAITSCVYTLKEYATSLDEAGTGLKGISGADGWTGEAADAFHAAYDNQPGRWLSAADAFSAAEKALDGYASTLSWAQGQAAEAVNRYSLGDSKTDQAVIDFDNACDEAESRAAQQSRMSGTPVPPHYPTWSDPGEADRAAARDILSRAREQVLRAGDDAEKAVAAATEGAPSEPSFLDKALAAGKAVVGTVADAAYDATATVVNAVASFGNAMVEHPVDTALMLIGAATTAAGTTMEEGGVALDATGVGAIAGVPLNIAGAAVMAAGATATLAGAGSLAQHAQTDSRVEPMESRASQTSGGSPGRKGTPTDRAKEHLTDRDLDAARRELNGEVVKRKAGGEPWNHVQEVRETQKKLVNRIETLKRKVGDTRLGQADRDAAQSELTEASRLLEHSKRYVPRK